jgi:hypothetical protein
MSILTRSPSVQPAHPPVTPPAWRWVQKPHNGQGFLLIGVTLYLVTDEVFEYENGMAGRLFKLRKSDGTTYQLTLTADAFLGCDCPDATYRERSCKHCIAVAEAFRDLDRCERLTRWLEAAETAREAHEYRNKSHEADPMPI